MIVLYTIQHSIILIAQALHYYLLESGHTAYNTSGEFYVVLAFWAPS